MIRRILGFAAMAIVALVVLKIALGLLGLFIGIAVTVLVLAAMGYGFYLVLRIVSPATAEWLRDMIRGSPRPTP